MRTMLSPAGSAIWEEGRISPLWAYYPGFEIRGIEGPVDGTSDTFRARIRLTGYDGLDADEVITMAPGVDLDGMQQDLVIVDARPAGSANHPQPVDLPDGSRQVTLRTGEEAEFPAGVLSRGGCGRAAIDGSTFRSLVPPWRSHPTSRGRIQTQGSSA